jgi:hypothetical protein
MKDSEALNLLPVFILLFILVVILVKGECCNRQNR